jgi:hypothetical protein
MPRQRWSILGKISAVLALSGCRLAETTSSEVLHNDQSPVDQSPLWAKITFTESPSVRLDIRRASGGRRDIYSTPTISCNPPWVTRVLSSSRDSKTQARYLIMLVAMCHQRHKTIDPRNTFMPRGSLPPRLFTKALAFGLRSRLLVKPSNRRIREWIGVDVDLEPLNRCVERKVRRRGVREGY